MTPETTASNAPHPSRERAGFAVLVALLLSPVLAHGAWRPWMHIVGTAGRAATVTAASLAVSALVALGWRLGPHQPLLARATIGALVATVVTASGSLGVAGLLSLLAVAGMAAWLLPWLSSRLPAAFDGLATRHKALTVLYALVAVASVASVARLSVFIGDPARADMQMLPGDTFVETHSCLTAYVRALTLCRQRAPNLYADHWWYGSNGLPALPAGVALQYPPFGLDNFSYPPTFLLLASVLAPLEGDFAAQRALWFGLNGLLLAVGLWVLARFVEGPRAHRVLLLAPLFFGSLPVLITLQIGNFQIAAVVLALLAMVTLARGNVAAGGALLALTVLSKISPGVLGMTLLVRRRWREVLVTAGWGALLVVVAALRFGRGPLVSFVTYALPRLSAGTAFPFMGTESGIVTNMSPFGVPFKLRLLGMHVGDPWGVGRRAGHLYTLGVVVLAMLSARREGDRRERALRWMALLVLSALQSPFCPGYAVLGLLWATTLLATEVTGLLGGLGLVALWVLILFVPPGLSPEFRAVQSMAQTTLVVAVCAWIAVRAPRREGPADPSGASFTH